MSKLLKQSIIIFMVLPILLCAQEKEKSALERQNTQEQLNKEKQLRGLLEKAQILQQKSEALSEKESQAIYEYFNQYDKEAIKRLEFLKSNNINGYQNQLHQLYFDKLHLQRMQEESPERFDQLLVIRKMESKSLKLAEDYHKEKSKSKKTEIENELKEVLNELFDLREKEKKIEMKRIEEKLQYLDDEISQRRENKEIIVENRLKQLTGQNKLYEW